MPLWPTFGKPISFRVLLKTNINDRSESKFVFRDHKDDPLVVYVDDTPLIPNNMIYMVDAFGWINEEDCSNPYTWTTCLVTKEQFINWIEFKINDNWYVASKSVAWHNSISIKYLGPKFGLPGIITGYLYMRTKDNNYIYSGIMYPFNFNEIHP